MHILYIHQYFATPNGSTGTRSYEFVRRWVEKGHKVRMLTTTTQLTSEDLAESQGQIIKRFTIDGIDVCAFNLHCNNKMGFIRRSISFIVFFVLSSLFVLFTKRPDVIYATSTPLPVGIPALTGNWCRKIPFVFEVRDQWPEIPIELGIIRNKFLIRILLWLERTIYKYSSAIIACSPGQAEGIKKVYTSSKLLVVVPNSCDTDKFRSDIDGTEIRRQYGWGNKFVFFHAGAMGKVNSLHFVIDAAEKLKDNKDILFALLGQGNEKSILEKKVSKLNLSNVQILPSVPKYMLPEVFAAADVGLVIIGSYPIIQHNSANKFFDSLSAGKPVLLNYSGWQRKILEDNSAGFGCDLYNLDKFIEKVLYLSSHPQEVKQMGLNARKLAIERFGRDRLAQKALDVITSL